MENLVAQVPELKLTKKVETRTTHFKDIQEAVFLKNVVGKEGDVAKIEIWTDAQGHHWSRADVLYYMKVTNLLDSANELINDVKKAKEANGLLQHVTMN